MQAASLHSKKAYSVILILGDTYTVTTARSPQYTATKFEQVGLPLIPVQKMATKLSESPAPWVSSKLWFSRHRQTDHPLHHALCQRLKLVCRSLFSLVKVLSPWFLPSVFTQSARPTLPSLVLPTDHSLSIFHHR